MYSKKVLFGLASFFFLNIPLMLCASESDSIPRRKIRAQRIKIAPKMDGVLDESVWQNASIATDFTERYPRNGRSAPDSLRTEVKILYDNLGIYFGAIMYDPHPEKIMKELTERDHMGADDVFAIMLNGYNDHQQSLIFNVTAAGVQVDSKLTGNVEDISWNAIWYSGVQINKDNWVAEVFIPYSELRFPEKKVQQWGLNMERQIQRMSTRYSWNHVNNTKGNFSLYDGEVVGLQEIETPTRLSFQPYQSSYVNKYNGRTNYNFIGGLDVKYGINDAFTLDMILIPDFGQAAFDETVLNLSAFEVQYKEQRPFFTEGTELFAKGGLFYSRRIGGAPYRDPELTEEEELVLDPSSVALLNAFKISGRTNDGLGIGVFNAVTERTFAEIRDRTTREIRDYLVNPFTNYNVVVLDQRFNGNSSISLVNTNTTREGGFRDANATGIYTKFVNENNTMQYSLDAEGSWVMEDRSKFGLEGRAAIEKINGQHRIAARMKFRTPDYDINDLGYLGPNNIITYFLNYNYRILQPKGFMNRLLLDFNFLHDRRLSPDLYGNFMFNFNYTITTKDQFSFGGGFETTPFGTQDLFEARTEGYHFDVPTYYDTWIRFSTDMRKRLSLDGLVDWYKYDERGRGRLILELSPRYRFSDRFKLNYSAAATLSDKEEGFVTSSEEDIIFGKRNRNTIINSLEGQFIVNHKMSFNLAFRHYISEVFYSGFYDLNQDGSLSALPTYSENHDTTYNSWNLDLRYSWWFAPGSQMTLLYRHAVDSYAYEAEQSLRHNINDLFDQPQVNSLSLRLTYFLDFNRMKNWFDSSRKRPRSRIGFLSGGRNPRIF